LVKYRCSNGNFCPVTTDGSISYASAIREAHPHAIQVSDRFHLIKNLTDYCKEHIQKLFNSKIKIAVIQSQSQQNADDEKLLSLKERMKYYSKMDKVNNVKMLKETGFSIKQIGIELGMDIRTANKYRAITDADEVFNKKDAPQKAVESTVLKKTTRILEVRELKEQGFSIREIERRTGYARKTIKRYLDPNVALINGGYGIKAGGILAPYHSEIDELLLKGHTFKNIEELIRAKGYTGVASTIRMYVSRTRRIAKDIIKASDSGTELVEKRHLIKLLYKPIKYVNNLTIGQLESVITQYPIMGQLYSLVSTFKEIVLKKEYKKLPNWIQSATSLNISGINSFIIGITRDIDAVTNAAKYEYNNGLAEGSVNKIKVIKRVMYGRCKFETLRSKVLWLEKNK